MLAGGGGSGDSEGVCVRDRGEDVDAVPVGAVETVGGVTAVEMLGGRETTFFTGPLLGGTFDFWGCTVKFKKNF